ncbi:MAG: hypothetical protein H0U81_00340 [Pyrinomonadaceae bacterium]|nr:hypothetical protein [Pyrinomonadaceae bacterium]
MTKHAVKKICLVLTLLMFVPTILDARPQTTTTTTPPPDVYQTTPHSTPQRKTVVPRRRRRRRFVRALAKPFKIAAKPFTAAGKLVGRGTRRIFRRGKRPRRY